MSDFSLKADEAISIFSGNLVVGNQDSITLFGIHPQNSLKEYSRRITALLLKETAELDMAISDIVAEIEHFELKTRRPVNVFLGWKHRKKEMLRDYSRILSYIESMTLYFKLQQAQLIKENKLLEKLASTVCDCTEELEQYIAAGNAVLSKRPPCNNGTNHSPSLFDTESSIDGWYARLQKRLDDLSISRTVSQQSQAQIKLLYDNNIALLDKIASAITITFPIWQNQMALVLGVELLESRLTVQNTLVDTGTRYIGRSSKQLLKKNTRRQRSPIELSKIEELNHILHSALNEVAHLEENDEILRKQFLDAAHHIERGE